MPYLEKRNHFSEPSFDVFVPARRQDPLGIVEGVVLEGNKRFVPWIGLSSIRELALKYAEKTRLVDRAELDENRMALINAEERIERLISERDALEARLDRIAGLSKEGYKVQKVVGRPAKTKVEVKS
jgi:hypothetical protein